MKIFFKKVKFIGPRKSPHKTPQLHHKKPSAYHVLPAEKHTPPLVSPNTYARASAPASMPDFFRRKPSSIPHITKSPQITSILISVPGNIPILESDQ
jgi:hypothetical protein